ncbi:hypothetical protein ACJ73_03101 [Blastomyces percursus]|uniref:Uncharacterized protein n=1 Tax=Blastomyces percursus TaxID=1658174 RepID=A0A1J9QBS6_9EURO|nr:hypothetical protein ACJ73_03101 [Blastomyces percursus]
MNSDGLRRRHIPYFTDEDWFGNDPLSPVKRRGATILLGSSAHGSVTTSFETSPATNFVARFNLSGNFRYLSSLPLGETPLTRHIPELQPLHIGRERVYYITMFSKPELIAYNIRIERQLYRLTLPKKVNNKSHYPQFYLIFDMDNEFVVYVSRDFSPSSPFIYVTLEFKEQPNVTAFALEQRNQSVLKAKYDLIIFEKYALQPDGLFAVASRDSFLLNISASPERTFIKLSDADILSDVGAALGEDGLDERIDNWLTLSMSSCITLPPKATGSKARRPLEFRGIDTHLVSKVSFWGERGILLHVNGFRPPNSDATYASDFTPKT